MRYSCPSLRFHHRRRLHQGHDRVRGRHALRGWRRLQLRRACRRRSPACASPRSRALRMRIADRTDRSRAAGVDVYIIESPRLDADAPRVSDRERGRTDPDGRRRRRPFARGARSRISTARTFLVSASIRGEVPLDGSPDEGRCEDAGRLDVQGFVRMVGPRRPAAVRAWPEQRARSRAGRHPEDRRRRSGIPDRHRGHPRGRARILAGSGPREIVLTHKDGLLVLADGKYHEAPFRPRAAARPQRPRRYLRRLVLSRRLQRGARRGDALGRGADEPQAGSGRPDPPHPRRRRAPDPGKILRDAALGRGRRSPCLLAACAQQPRIIRFLRLRRHGYHYDYQDPTRIRSGDP